jgi:pilus assembly protein CpaF
MKVAPDVLDRDLLDRDLLDRVRDRLAGEGGHPTPGRVAAALRLEGGGLRGDVEVLTVLRSLQSEIVGAGPLEPLLADPRTTDVLVNGPDEVWVDRGTGLERVAVRFSDETAVRRLASRLIAPTGRRLDDAQPWVDARLPGGIRLHAILPPVSSGGTCLSLRIPRRKVFDLAELVSSGTVPQDGADLLRRLISARIAFLVSGGTGTGKTTLLAALLSLVDRGDRLLLVEDAGELMPDHPHVVRLEARPPNVEGVGEVSLRDLVRNALRMRPDRLVVGEVRGGEVVDLLAALNTGHPGILQGMSSGAPRAAIYCRISKKEAKVEKVELQQAACRDLAGANGYLVQGVFIDDGVSASSGATRPGWQGLLTAIAKGEFDIVLAVEEERFTRDDRDRFEFSAICVAAEVSWHTCRGGLIDPDTADGHFISTIMGALGKREVRRKAERQLAGNEARRLVGLPSTAGVRPFGFEVDRIRHREGEAHELREAYKVVLEGGSLRSILRGWDERGVRTTRGKSWSQTSLTNALKRPRNAGLVQRGKDQILYEVTAAWKPIVGREDWEKVRKILSDPGRRYAPNREPRWLSAGIARCGTCDAYLRSGSLRGRPVYRCSTLFPVADGRPHSTIGSHRLDGLVANAIVASFLHAPSAALPDDLGDTAVLGAIQVQISEVRATALAINEVIGQPGVSTAVQLKKLAELNGVELGLEAKLLELTRRSAHAAMLVKSRNQIMNPTNRKTVSIPAAAELRSEYAGRFAELPLAHRRTLMRSLLEVRVDSGRSADRVRIRHSAAPTLDWDHHVDAP